MSILSQILCYLQLCLLSTQVDTFKYTQVKVNLLLLNRLFQILLTPIVGLQQYYVIRLCTGLFPLNWVHVYFCSSNLLHACFDNSATFKSSQLQVYLQSAWFQLNRLGIEKSDFSLMFCPLVESITSHSADFNNRESEIGPRSTQNRSSFTMLLYRNQEQDKCER